MTSLLEFVAEVLRLHGHRYFEDMDILGRSAEVRALREALTDVEDLAVEHLRTELRVSRATAEDP